MTKRNTKFYMHYNFYDDLFYAPSIILFKFNVYIYYNILNFPDYYFIFIVFIERKLLICFQTQNGGNFSKNIRWAAISDSNNFDSVMRHLTE